jgi:hypothetical protein
VAAFAPGGAPDPAALPRVFTFEACVAAHVLHTLHAGEEVAAARELNLIQTASHPPLDAFQTKLDAYTLDHSLKVLSPVKRRLRIVPRRA